ncbi:MAG: hypothetical protein PHW50_01690 [Patescibacteria group bacterium]|nr:hypothetical protein [Patescibacteria group bacterium]
MRQQNDKQKNFILKNSKGSALLYTVVLIGALLIVGELAFSYIVFSLNSRRESYSSQVNYWLAWGGSEAALSQINNFETTATSAAFCRWPNQENNLIESPKLVSMNASSENIYKNTEIDSKLGFYSRFSASYFTKISPQNFSIMRDQSQIFDLSKFSGSLQIHFYPYGDLNNVDDISRNVLWLRLEENTAGHTVREAIVRFVLKDGAIAMEKNQDENFPQNLINFGACVSDANSRAGDFTGYKCTVNIMPFVAGQNRFFKIKTYKGDADLRFDFNNNANPAIQLGTPSTIIKAIGQMGVNDANKKELFIKFPNQLKSVSDVLDYSIYQAEF